MESVLDGNYYVNGSPVYNLLFVLVLYMIQEGFFQGVPFCPSALSRFDSYTPTRTPSLALMALFTIDMVQ